MTSENERRRIIDVDSLQRELSVRQVAAYYGASLPEHFGDGGEQRMSCPCRDCRGHEDGRSVSINTGKVRIRIALLDPGLLISQIRIY